jgi:hypothetical protein
MRSGMLLSQLYGLLEGFSGQNKKWVESKKKSTIMR